MKKTMSLMIVIAFFLGGAQLVCANTIFVNCNGGGDYTTIQEGINAAINGDTVLVANGIYTGANNKNLSWDGYVKHLAIKSENGYEYCIIDCENDGRGFLFNETHQTHADIIEGFTIQNAKGTWGGGIKCNDASPIIQYNRITNCESGYNHIKGPGGGILLYKNCEAIVQNNTIDNNLASADDLAMGGGICCYHNDDTNAQPIIRNNIIYNNGALEDASGGGGGICIYFSSPIVENNLIYDNYTDWYGGGIHCLHGGNPIIRNNIIIDNNTTHPSPSGGGISIVGAQPLLLNNIVTNNDDYGICYLYGSVSIQYCNVWGNLEGNYYSCSPGIGCVNEDPLFVDLSSDDFHFQENSSCIDAGTPDTTGMNLPPFDLDGNPRIVDGNGDGIAIIDMGCYEFDSDLPVPIFIDVANQYGVNDSRQGNSAVWFDFDNDGDLDILVTTQSNSEYPDLYRNDGNVFIDVGDEVVLSSINHRLSIGDYDNDGDLDFCSHALFRNDINETYKFTEIGYYDGVGRLSFIDYDNDGDLDIYNPRQGSSSGNGAHNRLFRNDGDDGFVEVENALGADDCRFSRIAVWADYDNDGDMDVYVVNGRGQRCSLYRNDVNATGLFIDVTDDMGVGDTEGYADGASWADYDNDGDLDLYLNKHDANPNCLYRNDGYVFTEVADEFGVANTHGGFHSSWGDYDNDGDLDLYVTSWEGYPNCLYRNEVSEGNGFIETNEMKDISATGMGGSWGDFDCDGDLDYYLVSGYYSSEPNRLYQNSSSEDGNHWLNINAVGTMSNHSAIGTTVRIVSGNLKQMRYVESSSGYGSQNSLPVEFGLGAYSIVDSVIVNWPSGIKQIFTDVNVNQFLTIIEPYSPVQPIYLSIPTEYALPGDTVLVPINVQFPQDSTFTSAEIIIGGYLGSLEFLELIADSSLVGYAGWMYESNETDSLNTIWMAGSEPISGEDILIWMKFVVADTGTGFIPITLEDALFDTGVVPVELTSGGINIVALIYGDVDFNGSVQAYDASMILQYLVGYINLDDLQLSVADVSLDSTVSALDATLILQYGVGIIDTLPYQPGSSYIANGDITMEDQVYTGDPIDVPIIITNAENIYSFEGMIHFDTECLTLAEVYWSEYLDGFCIWTDVEGGEFKLVGSGALPYEEYGVMATIRFYPKSVFITYDSTTVFFKNIKWNENDTMHNIAASVITNNFGVNNPQEPDLILRQNNPNPFSYNTKIQYSIPLESAVSLKIYNIKGELIADLVNEFKDKGSYDVFWDGRDKYGNKAVNGIYFYKFISGDSEIIKRMILLR